MRKTVGEIAKLVDGEVVGDPRLVITGVSGIKEAQEGDITFLANPKYSPLIEKTAATAILVFRDIKESAGKTLIRTDNPSLAFAKVASMVVEADACRLEGVHQTAVIAKDVHLGKNVAIGPHVVVEKGAVVGDNTVIYAGSFVGHHAVIGKDCLIYPNVTIRERVSVGDRVIIHSGTVIGSDGFGFVNVEGLHSKIPQVGTVVVEDDVEIGANVTVDRARFDKTVIGRGTKIDNLVQIAHNVRIGKNCIIVSQVGISGSTIVGDNVVLAGQVGLVGHITIGDGAVVAAKSGVPNSVAAHTMVWGIPAKPHMQAKRVNACVQRLPHYIDIINDLKKRIEELEAKLLKH